MRARTTSGCGGSCAGTTTVQESFKGWQMPAKRPSLGVAMVGDQLFTLIPAAASVPCMAKQVRSCSPSAPPWTGMTCRHCEAAWSQVADHPACLLHAAF